MSGSLNEIKKKIQATKNTRKITKAMQLVAASKMRVFQKKAVNSREFSWDLLAVLRSSLADHVDHRRYAPEFFLVEGLDWHVEAARKAITRKTIGSRAC